jgi:hypothetical protein
MAILTHEDTLHLTDDQEATCCGQGKTDTELSNPSNFLIFIGTDIPEIRVLPSAVVEHLDVRDNIVSCLLTRGVISVRRPLAFETAKEAFGHGIIKTLALTTPTTDDPMVCQHVLIRVTGILTAAICMMQQTGGGMTPSQCHPQRVLHQSCIDPTTHRPPYHFTRIQVQ